MKKAALSFFILSLFINGFSQQMQVKQPNFTSFRTDKKITTETLAKNSTSSAKQHPEYGVLPYSSQCSECVELIDKRSIDTRLFIKPNNAGHTYSQRSYFPLHYKKSETDIWRTIDPRLRPETNQPGVYIANNQPVPTKCDLNKRSTSLTESGFEFEFNKNLTLWFFDDNTAYTKREQGNYSNYTIGEEGLRVTNMWDGITMEQQFSKGEIKTSYIFNSAPQLPINKGWMVIEDHFTLPEGYTFEESALGKHSEEGYFQGDYLLKNEKGQTLITYEKPVYLDTKAWGMHGHYKLLQNGNDYSLQMLIPVDWFSKPGNTYPLTIDPIVSGVTKTGNFRQTGMISANMAFTSMSLGSCDYFMIVPVPGESEIKDAYVDVEYQLTYDNTCGVPPLPAPYCTFSQVTMEVRSDVCNTTTGLLACDPANPPFTGTCTTDPNLVPGAGALHINSFVPNYLACYDPQCPDYNIPFTLKNRDSICLDQCGYLCARGNMWQMTIEACKVEGDIIQNRTQVCAGEPVTFTARPECGVPPYHYVWTSDGGNTFDTIYGNATYTIYPQADVIVACNIFDTCNEFWTTNELNVAVVPAPSAEAGDPFYLCEGGTIVLGGNPTTNGPTIAWTGENATVQSWLNATNIANPTATIPTGTVDTFFYVVRASDFTCFRTDTVRVYSAANPDALIDTTGGATICSNQSVNITVAGTYSYYNWSNGSTQPSIAVNQSGQYFVVVTDQNGCRDTSNVIAIAAVTPPSVSVFPDTLITFGDSVRLFTDINLNAASIDSFRWYPVVNISCTTCSNPIVSPESDTYYSVVVHTLGCTISDSALIRVILPNNFYIPNAFSPNGDGNNDVFQLFSQSGVEVLSFQVFNRWGEKVHDNLSPWDGNYKGKPAPQGVYVYVFKISLFGDQGTIFRKGSVTLMR